MVCTSCVRASFARRNTCRNAVTRFAARAFAWVALPVFRNRLQGNDSYENCFPSDLVKKLVLVVAGVLALAFTVRAGAESITLQWDTPVDGSEISGYEVRHRQEGVVSEEFLLAYGTGTDTRLVDNLGPGEPHYFAVRSYSDDGRKSAFSNEIPVTIPPPPIGDSDGDGVGDGSQSSSCSSSRSFSSAGLRGRYRLVCLGGARDN